MKISGILGFNLSSSHTSRRSSSSASRSSGSSSSSAAAVYKSVLNSNYNVVSVSILFLLCLPCITRAELAQITLENFDEYTSKYEFVFLNFYADWCRFSQILAPVFEEAHKKVVAEFPEPDRVLFGKVDCESQTNLATRFHISKYPTLKLMMNGKILKREYRGQRSVEAITNHVRDLFKDPIKAVSTMDEFRKIDDKKGAIIVYYEVEAGKSPEYNVYRKVANDLKDECGFYWVTGEPSVNHGHQGKTNFLVFKPPRAIPSEKDLIYPGTLQSYDELSTWATDKCIPLVREITFENAEELTEEGLPFLILFHAPEDKESHELYTKLVSTELFSESSSINFLTADGLKFAHPLHHLGKTQKDLPLVAIDSFRHMYLFPKFSDIKIPGKLKQFIQDLHSGKLHREFHFGPESTPEITAGNDDDSNKVIQTQPPESTFKKLAPSSNRYTLLRDEL